MLRDKRAPWCIYGDSIACQKWLQRTVSWMTHSKCVNMGIGGSTACNNGQIWYANTDGTYFGRPVQDRLTDRDSIAKLKIPKGKTIHEGWGSSFDRLSTQMKPEYGAIVVILGTNDCGQCRELKEFEHALIQMLDYIKIHVPSCNVYLCTPLPRKGEGTLEYVNDIGLGIKEYSDVVKKVAFFRQVNCIDLYAECAFFKEDWDKYFLDGIHPTRYGSIYIGKFIATKVLNKKENHPEILSLGEYVSD